MIILFRKGNILFHRAILSIVNLNSIQCLTERPNSQPKVKQNTAHFKVHLTPKLFFGRDETVQHSHKEFDNFISICYF